ncbi:tyrosine-type recombinase/integrase [Crenothrix sp.]|uniref:tyrosine-type recombinase/integrase n=1 Tax=Crenothrix sp. TaxID=3100433 RepID=UPI00374DBDF4
MIELISLENVSAFDQIAIPLDLSGSEGENRATESCRIDADNDLAAIKSWLRIKGENPKTYQAYQKELERFLLWAVIERGKAFSSLNTDDCQAYINFIKQLQADNSRWVAITPTNKGHGRWKPFQYRVSKKNTDTTTVLSIRSVNYANTVISSCMDWLVSQNYLKYNSFSGIAASKSASSGMQVSQRLFTRQHIQLMLDYAHSLCDSSQPDHYAQLRVLFILKFAFNTGLRLHELAAASYGDIEALEDADGEQYFLRVVGKNSKLRKTSLPTAFIADIRAYRIAMKLSPVLENIADDTPLINSLRKKVELQLSPAALHKILADFFKRWHAHLMAADQLDNRLINKVKQASTHWLRHSYGSFLANDCKIPLAYIRDELGHASISTTSIYLNADDKKRQQAVSAAFVVNTDA